MKVLGITGGIGAGKSTVTAILSALGGTVIDADVIAREVMEPTGSAYGDVVETFGREILQEDGQIHRKKLASLVFGDKKKLDCLNQLTHPRVMEEMQRQIDGAETELVCLDVPLLFSCQFTLTCDATLAVIAPYEVRIARVMERDGCTREQVEERIRQQLPDEVLREKADYWIENNGNFADLKKKVAEVVKKVMERAE